MYFKHITTITFLLIFGSSISQNRELNALIMIDELPVSTGTLRDVSLSFSNKDKILLYYKIGRFIIKESDFLILTSKKDTTEVTLNLTYEMTCPENKTLEYSSTFNLKHLLQRELILKIYNFEKYPRVFGKKKSYGSELSSPLGAILLPKNRKLKRNKCLDLE